MQSAHTANMTYDLIYNEHYYVTKVCQNHSDQLMNVVPESVFHREAVINTGI